MELYVGMDVSLKQTSICVVDGGGAILCEGTVLSDPAAIAEFIKAKAAGTQRIGLESGPTATWLWHELRTLGLPVICIDARHAKAALTMQINKSDRNDALGLARIMQCGWYKEVRVKSLESHELRALLSSRALLVKIKRDLDVKKRLIDRDYEEISPNDARAALVPQRKLLRNERVLINHGFDLDRSEHQALLGQLVDDEFAVIREVVTRGHPSDHVGPIGRSEWCH